MSTRALKIWFGLHTWASLISTVILLVLFITGLPLIFRGEINHAMGYGARQNSVTENIKRASIDKVVQTGLAHFPGEVVQYVVWEPGKPNIVTLSMALAPDADFFDNHNLLVDAYTAEVVDDTLEPLDFFVKLHTQLFLGAGGAAILGLMALLFLVALVSGLVIYGPFMKNLDFGEIRKRSSNRVKWLDLHNLTGKLVRTPIQE